MRASCTSADLRVGRFGTAALVLGLSLIFLACPVFARARLLATPSHVDMGFIEEGTLAVTSIVVENVGDGDVTITNVRTN